MKPSLVIGLDIGGSKTKSVLMSDLKPVKFFEIRYDNKRLKTAQMKQIISQAIENFGPIIKKIKRIGVAVPCVVVNGKTTRLHINPTLEKIDLKRFLEKKYSVSVVIENDVNLAALGEWFFGFKQKPESLFLINLATGCGAGFIKGGKIFKGFKSSALELGHMTTGQNEGKKCTCGEYDHLECYLSSRYFKLQKVNPMEELEKAKQGNKRTGALFKKLGAHLGSAVANIINLLEPKEVVVTGGLINAGHFFLDEANRVCKKNIFLKRVHRKFKIKIAKTGKNATVLGAALAAVGRY